MSSSDRTTSAGPPFQFTVRQLLALTAICAAALALISQGGLLGLIICYFAGCLAAVIWGISRGPRAWLEVGVAGLIAGLSVGFLLLPTIGHQDRVAAPRMVCSNHLKQIGLALHNYHDVYGSFPPAYIADKNGQPMHSWRVLILPFAEQKPLYDLYRFDEPWDGPNNRKLHTQYPAYFCCPACYGKQPKFETNYLAVVGPQTMWPGTQSVNLSKITDGTANTLMVVEVANSGIHWMEPRDLHVTQMPLAINPPRGQGISSPHRGAALALFVDAHTAALPNDTPPKALRSMLTIAGNDNADLPP